MRVAVCFSTHIKPATAAFLRNRGNWKTQSHTGRLICGLRGAFEQSPRFRSTLSVFTSVSPATKPKSRTCATRATDVIFERKHCSRRRRYTQVELTSPRKCADKTQTIARKRWHSAGSTIART